MLIVTYVTRTFAPKFSNVCLKAPRNFFKFYFRPFFLFFSASVDASSAATANGAVGAADAATAAVVVAAATEADAAVDATAAAEAAFQNFLGAGIRTRDSATANRCAPNELHSPLTLLDCA